MRFVCLLCGKESDPEGLSSERWSSWLVLMPFEEAFTVCPKCRRKTINDAYLALMEGKIWG